jgi:hypothetical protein
MDGVRTPAISRALSANRIRQQYRPRPLRLARYTRRLKAFARRVMEAGLTGGNAGRAGALLLANTDSALAVLPECAPVPAKTAALQPGMRPEVRAQAILRGVGGIRFASGIGDARASRGAKQWPGRENIFNVRRQLGCRPFPRP